VVPPPPESSKEKMLLSDIREILQEKRWVFVLKLLGFTIEDLNILEKGILTFY
jgi:hypothetical protein